MIIENDNYCLGGHFSNNLYLNSAQCSYTDQRYFVKGQPCQPRGIVTLNQLCTLWTRLKRSFIALKSANANNFEQDYVIESSYAQYVFSTYA